ncbi:MAG: zinc-ribbon domain-containing protein [Proteobacteria bacterium]|nr:zinc-ribbon domain-containing protein [Pseudomonadota bacterium]
MFCISCGHRNPDEADFCMKCGAKIPRDASADAGNAAHAATAAAPAVSPSSSPGQGDVAHGTAQKPHVPPLPAEQEVWSGAMSLKGMLTWGWVLAFVLPVPIVGGAFYMRARFEGQAWLLSLVSLLPLAVFACKLMVARSTHFRLTTERITVVSGIFSRTSVDLQLIRVADVQFFQSLLGRLLDVGDIRLLTTDKAAPDLVIPGVDQPADFKEKIWNLVRDRRRNLVPMEQLNQSLTAVSGEGPGLF